MKKRICSLSLLIALLLTGCGDGQTATAAVTEEESPSRPSVKFTPFTVPMIAR